jgi:hypothetical protein
MDPRDLADLLRQSHSFLEELVSGIDQLANAQLVVEEQEPPQNANPRERFLPNSNNSVSPALNHPAVRNSFSLSSPAFDLLFRNVSVPTDMDGDEEQGSGPRAILSHPPSTPTQSAWPGGMGSFSQQIQTSLHTAPDGSVCRRTTTTRIVDGVRSTETKEEWTDASGRPLPAPAHSPTSSPALPNAPSLPYTQPPAATVRCVCGFVCVCVCMCMCVFCLLCVGTVITAALIWYKGAHIAGARGSQWATVRCGKRPARAVPWKLLRVRLLRPQVRSWMCGGPVCRVAFISERLLRAA